MNDIKYMRHALDLAKKGIGYTNPNPMVGAVIVKDGKIIGQGYHQKAGEGHAETEALANANRAKLHDTTMYVNLEPCSTTGKVVPCTDAIIAAGIKKVILATTDPNPTNSKKGIEVLKKAGIDVAVGVLEEEAQNLNETFFTFYTKHRPFVAIKYAASLDGNIATRTNDSKWITNEESRKRGYELRGMYQAILVGSNTILQDNPNLGSHGHGPDPLRIVIDAKQRIPKDAQMLRDNNILVIEKDISFSELMNVLHDRNIISLLVEGGGNTIGRFIDEKLFDKLYAFYAPILIGGKDAVGAVGAQGTETIKNASKLRIENIEHIGEDLLITAYPKN